MKDSPSYIIEFDSSSSMLYALGRCLHGQGFPGAGFAARMPGFMAPVLNGFPEWLRELGYSWGGWLEASTLQNLRNVDSEEISRWVTAQYPSGSFPAMMIGSSNGAAVHLGAALGIPWLPQTYLSAVRRFLDPDDLKGDLAWGRKFAGQVLGKNPSLQIHQMKDPLQDRLMVARMAYFRLKRRELGEVYENFIRKNVTGEGTLISVECRYSWPQAKVSERHFFQTGGLGGLGPLDYINGNETIAAFLKRKKSRLSKWDAPKPDADRPEAEWGFEEALLEDMRRFAAANGLKLKRIVFDHPEDLSPFVADLYRWWYAKRAMPSRRLLVPCFAFLDPWWTIKTGSVPFWIAFNTECSEKALADYLAQQPEPFQDIYLILMSNGVAGVGLVPVERWRAILSKAVRKGDFLGTDTKKYPSDFGTFITYHKELKSKITDRYHFPERLSLQELEEFIRQTEGRYRVEWHEDALEDRNVRTYL